MSAHIVENYGESSNDGARIVLSLAVIPACICACTSLGLAPASTIQVACEVRRQRQLIQGRPSLRGGLTAKEIEESTRANRNTVKAHLRKLASDNYLAQVGKGRGARYTLK